MGEGTDWYEPSPVPIGKTGFIDTGDLGEAGDMLTPATPVQPDQGGDIETVPPTTTMAKTEPTTSTTPATPENKGDRAVSTQTDAGITGDSGDPNYVGKSCHPHISSIEDPLPSSSIAVAIFIHRSRNSCNR